MPAVALLSGLMTKDNLQHIIKAVQENSFGDDMNNRSMNRAETDNNINEVVTQREGHE